MNITSYNIKLEQKQMVSMNYLLYKPKEVQTEGLPLLLYLHGSGQCGNNLDLVKMHWPPAYYSDIPMLILAPQCPDELPLSYK